MSNPHVERSQSENGEQLPPRAWRRILRLGRKSPEGNGRPQASPTCQSVNNTISRNKSVEQQPQCSFLTKLPLELREMVYSYAFVPTALVQVFNPGNTTQEDTVMSNGRPWSSDKDTFSILHSRTGTAVSMPSAKMLTAFPRTCRQVYIEAKPYIYKQFDVHVGQVSRVFAMTPLRENLAFLLRHLTRLTLQLTFSRLPQLISPMAVNRQCASFGAEDIPLPTWRNICRNLGPDGVVPSLQHLRIFLDQLWFFQPVRGAGRGTRDMMLGVLGMLKMVDPDNDGANADGGNADYQHPRLDDPPFHNRLNDVDRYHNCHDQRPEDLNLPEIQQKQENGQRTQRRSKLLSYSVTTTWNIESRELWELDPVPFTLVHGHERDGFPLKAFP